MDNSFLTQLKQIRDESTSYSFAKKIKQNSELLAWIHEQTKHKLPPSATASERGYYLLYGKPECPYGNNRKYLTASRGYGYCARPEKCQCQKDDNSVNSQSHWAQKTKEQKNQIQKKRNKTNLEKYGVENVGQTQQAIDSRNENYSDPQKVKLIGDRIKKTKLKKYGDANWVNSEKRKKTCLERFGVEENLSRPEVQERITATNLVKYGTKRVRPNIDRIRKDSMEQYGVPWPNQKHISPESLENLSNIDWLKDQHYGQRKTLTQISNELGVSKSTVGKRVSNLGIEVKMNASPFSYAEEKLREYISSIYSGTIEYNNRSIIHPFEIDIVMPDLKLAIEYNGAYWHSDRNGRGRKYHLNKTIALANHGIQLIHIWEHDWIDKQDIIQSRLSNILKLNSESIYARKCKIAPLNKKTKKDFFNDNHLQEDTSSSVELGLFYNDKLVSAMSFGKCRYSSTTEWELIRFCSLKYTTVIGAAGRLFSHFKEEFSPTSVVSYANREWGDGEFYSKIGFTFSHYSNPGYKYTRNFRTFFNRTKFQKSKQERLLEHYDPNLSEWENMKNNKFDRIWDCGNSVYTYYR